MEYLHPIKNYRHNFILYFKEEEKVEFPSYKKNNA